MKALQLTAPGSPLTINEIEKPVPGSGQLLVRSIITAVNPVDAMMHSTGLLIPSYPTSLGCDASGVVAELGAGTTGFKVGDRVCGCTRLGVPGYGTWQEFFLMDAPLTIPTPKNISLEQAAALGVGTLTASLGLFAGLNIPLPDPTSLPDPKDEWVIVFGGAGSVGQYAVQIAKACGYKVLATCSSRNDGLLKSLGATSTLDYALDPATQLSTIKSLTGGNFSRAFDASSQSYPLAAKALAELSNTTDRYFSSTDDWSPFEPIPNTKTYRIGLGPIGRDGQDELHNNIKSYIPVIVGLVEKGHVVPNEIEILAEGLEKVWEAVSKGRVGGGKKGVVIIGQKEG